MSGALLLSSAAILRRGASASCAALSHNPSGLSVSFVAGASRLISLSSSSALAGAEGRFVPLLIFFRHQYSHCGGLSAISRWATRSGKVGFSDNASAVARLYARYVLAGAALAAAVNARRKAYCEAVTGVSMAGGLEGIEEEKGVIRIKTLAGEGSVMDVRSLLGDTALKRMWSAAGRILNLSFLAAPLAVLCPISILTDSPYLKNQSWEYALYAVEKAGPTFVKLCQWASTRSDLFPIEFCSRFARLQDATRGHPWEDTEHMLEAEFGTEWQDLLDLPNQRPIGSGCVGQVYRGRLKRTIGFHPKGTEVAVKIQHPNVKKKVTIDFYLLNKVSAFLESIPRLNLDFLSLSDTVDQFGTIMFPQLDLSCEAQNIERFRRDFSDDDTICFPQPVTELCSTELLVEHFVHGEPILSYLKEDVAVESRRDLAQKGLKAVLHMIFLHDFVHGDLHPGNIIVNKTSNGELCLNLIDCGLVVEMGPEDHKNLIKILGAFIKRDGRQAAELMIDTSKRVEGTELDMEMFSQGIQQICDDDLNNVSVYLIYMPTICFNILSVLLCMCPHRTFWKKLVIISLIFATWRASIRSNWRQNLSTLP
mmetsp:Transcript_15392/g.34488  ORF Transcript_15392/g.34488 Transcript_15392/m.34488 type:complete len:594 (-) Transcript_15392:420-2201(-)